MKSLLILFIVATIATIGLKAQTIIGFGGSVNGSSTKSSSQPNLKPVTSGINLYPKLGYLFYDKFAFGIGGGWGSSKTTYDETTTSELTIYKLQNWFVSPFIRYYSAKVRNFSFLVDGSMRYGGNKSTSKIADHVTQVGKSYKLIGYYLEPAVAYHFSNNFSIELSIGNVRYTSTEEKTSGVKSSGYYYSLGLESITGRLIFKLGSRPVKQKNTLDKYN